MKKYGIDEFEKQPGTDKFTVLGDNLGQFALLSRLRHWFPTTKTTLSYWTKIIFDIEEKRSELEISGKL